jgi:hypothetical membrane protein
VASAVIAPVTMFVTWTIAAALQASPYDPIRQTVSVLSAHGSTDRWVMTLGFLVVGGCDVITGLALRPASRAGRVLLVTGGFAGIMVGLSPETVGAPTPWRHFLFAALGFVLLTIWPVAATRGISDPDIGGDRPWALRPGPGLGGSLATLALFCWFTVELVAGGRQLGLAERALGELQAVWPLVVVVSCLLVPRTREPRRLDVQDRD